MVTEKRLPVTPAARRVARAMPTAARRAYLRARGWTQWTAYANADWRAPELADRGFYTLAAAIYVAVTREQQREGDGG